MAPSKRKNAAATTSSKKMKATEWSDISTVIMQAELSDETRDMLIEVLPYTLGEFSDHRHKYQEQMVSALEDVLKEVEGGLSNAVTDFEAQLETSKREKLEKDKTTEEVHQQKETKAAEVQEKKVALATAAHAFRSARDDKENADEKKRMDEKDAVDAEKKKTQFLSMMEDLDFLRIAAPDAPEASEKGITLVSMMNKWSFEESLQIALPSVFAKPPDARGKFDSVALDGLATAIRKRIDEQDEIIKSAAPLKEKHAVAIAAAEDALKGATNAQLLAAKAYEEAASGLRACTDEHSVAQKAAKEEKSKETKLTRSLTNAEAELEVFREGPLANFKQLQTRVEPVVEELPVAPQEQEPVSEQPVVAIEEEQAKVVEVAA